MSNPQFILKDDEYKCGAFPQIPTHNKNSSITLLTDGIGNDIIVDERTTVKKIRQGKYRRVIEISNISHSYEHEFNSSCKETSYTFTVKVKAKVYVHNPIAFYRNYKNIDIKEFFNNQFSFDVNSITRKYSILDYSGIDEDLKRELTINAVVDETTGLTYQISTVMTEPNDDAKSLLKKKDDMRIRAEMNLIASGIAQKSKGKSYEEAIWEEAVQGSFSETEAIRRIEEYNRKGYQEKLAALLQLRDEGFITDADIAAQAQTLLPSPSTTDTEELPTNSKLLLSADEYYDE